jgi:hypothetical protein
MVIPAKGYWIEGNNKYNDPIAKVDSTASQPDYTNWEMEHYDHMAKWFRTYFVGHDYLTVCGKCNEQNVLINIMEEKNIAPESQEEHSDSDEPAVHTSDIQYRVILRRTTVSDTLYMCNLRLMYTNVLRCCSHSYRILGAYFLAAI